MDPTALVGRKLGGRYLLRRLIGGGGMGVVYEAENVLVGKRVALKVLAPDLAAAPNHLVRFQREARAAAAIGHPSIVEVYDFGSEGADLVYFVMELVDGRTLAHALHAEPRFATARAVDVAGQILDALAAAHAAGIVHRDVKPDNVFLCRTLHGTWDHRAAAGAGGERVKILDFGISMFRGAAGRPGTAGETPVREARLTSTGAILGTAWYMSPEQAAGDRDVDHRTDIWAVGAILYEMLAGRPPFEGKTTVEVLYRVLKELPKPLCKASRGVPHALSGIVGRALAKDPAERFPDAAGFMEALRPFGPALPAEAGPGADDAPTTAVDTARRMPATLTPGATAGVRRTFLSQGAGALARAVAAVRSRRAPVIAAAGTLGAAILTAAILLVARGSGPARPAADGRDLGGSAAVADDPDETTDAAREPAPGNAVRPAGALPSGTARPPGERVAPRDADPAVAPSAIGPDALVPEETPPEPLLATLEVVGTDGAAILLDGLRNGEVPGRVPVPADGKTHTIVLRKAGFETRTAVVGPFEPGGSARVRLDLRPAQAPGPGSVATAPPAGGDAGAVTTPARDAAAPRDAATARPVADAGPAAVIRGPGGTIIRTTRRDGGS